MMTKILHKGIEEIPGPGCVVILHKELELVNQLLRIELAGRTAYRSANKPITRESAGKFIKMLIRRGHESVIEHSSITVMFSNVSRGFTHEMVRMRLCSFTQESTRYVDYARKGIPGEDEREEVDLDRFEMGFVMPPHQEFPEMDIEVLHDGYVTVRTVNLASQVIEDYEGIYRKLRKAGWPPEDARQFLPIGLTSKIVVTTNFREWRHIFDLRCAKAAHWEIRAAMCKLLRKLQEIIPEIFFDFYQIGVDKNRVPYYVKGNPAAISRDGDLHEMKPSRSVQVIE